MKKLTPEEKQAIEKKIQGEEANKPAHLTISDNQKEELKKMIAKAEKEKHERLDDLVHPRRSKRK